MSNTPNSNKNFSLKHRVHCHICPLKGLCPDNIRHTQSSYRIEKKRATQQDIINSEESTVNCPLKNLLDAAFPNILKKEASI